MATIVFDFDSTLIPVESLEEVLRSGVGTDADAIQRVEAITRRGMEGELDFRASLEARLAIASPTRAAALSTGEQLAAQLTPGAAECVAALRVEGHEIRIVSGGLRAVILPSARALGLSDADVHAVTVQWNDDGSFAGFVEDGFIDSKVEGLRRLDPDWSRPVIAVGDGATDRALATSGLADGFLAFTGHIRRDFVDAHDVPSVESMRDLSDRLTSLIPTLRNDPDTHG